VNLTVSIPRDLFQRAEALRKRLGQSRDVFYASAIAELSARLDGEEITRRLDAVYADHDSRLPEDLRRLRDRSLSPERW